MSVGWRTQRESVSERVRVREREREIEVSQLRRFMPRSRDCNADTIS